MITHLSARTSPYYLKWRKVSKKPNQVKSDPKSGVTLLDLVRSQEGNDDVYPFKRNTYQNRKYITKDRLFFCLQNVRRGKKREQAYDGYVRKTLTKVWEILDYSCGQRLAPLLKTEVDRLRKFGELLIPHGCPCLASINVT
jgi:hypothetical protein